MPLPALILWADSGKNEFVSGWQSTLDLAKLSFKQGDNVGIELHWVQRSGLVNQNMTEVIWPTSVNITAAIGRLDAAPLGGSFTLTYDSVTTDDIAYNATAQVVQDELNAIASINDEGGVTVTKTGTTYRIVWNTACVPAGTLALNTNDLTPTCSIGIAVARAGSVSARQITQLHIKQAPIAVCTSWVDQSAPVATVTQTHTPGYSGDFAVWRIALSPAPKSGTFRITTTVNGTTFLSEPIDCLDLTAQTIATAIGITNLTVQTLSSLEFELYQPQTTGDTTNITAVGTDSSGLIAFSSKFGTLSLNSLDVEYLLNGAASAQAVFEIEVEADGKRQTIAQTACTIYNDLIDADSYTLVEWGDVMPVDSVVRFDTSQSLTTPQKTQARTNIGALGSGDLSSINSNQVAMDTRLTTLESSAFTTNQKAAIAGADAPSATNVFVTASGLTTGLGAHTQAISTITGLQTALDGKAPTSHAHTIANVTGLQTELDDLNSNKAEVTHTHIIADVTGLQATLDDKTVLTVNQKAAITGATTPSASNVFATMQDVGGVLVEYYRVLYPYSEVSPNDTWLVWDTYGTVSPKIIETINLPAGTFEATIGITMGDSVMEYSDDSGVTWSPSISSVVTMGAGLAIVGYSGRYVVNGSISYDSTPPIAISGKFRVPYASSIALDCDPINSAFSAVDPLSRIAIPGTFNPPTGSTSRLRFKFFVHYRKIAN